MWQRIGTAWQLSDQHGLPMIDLLCRGACGSAGAERFRRPTRAGLAGPRATATVLAGLPALGIALGQATGADPVGVLTGGGLGGLLPIVGTALVVAGLCWSDRTWKRVSARNAPVVVAGLCAAGAFTAVAFAGMAVAQDSS